MTVLLVILTFALFITLDYVIELRKARRGTTVSPEKLAPPASTWRTSTAGEPVWVAGYQMLEDIHYHRGHTWARLLDDDTVLVGMDDFARKLMGTATGVALPPVGAHLEQGEKGFGVTINGKSADFVSPVEGRVLEVNPELARQPKIATDEPYGRGWIMKLQSSQLVNNLRNLMSGSLARSWMEDARKHLDLQLMALSGSVLQDGGEPVADFARHLSEEEWKGLVHEFLLT